MGKQFKGVSLLGVMAFIPEHVPLYLGKKLPSIRALLRYMLTFVTGISTQETNARLPINRPPE
jgi:hypothetical protein